VSRERNCAASERGGWGVSGGVLGKPPTAERGKRSNIWGGRRRKGHKKKTGSPVKFIHLQSKKRTCEDKRSYYGHQGEEKKGGVMPNHEEERWLSRATAKALDQHFGEGGGKGEKKGGGSRPSLRRQRKASSPSMSRGEPMDYCSYQRKEENRAGR